MSSELPTYSASKAASTSDNSATPLSELLLPRDEQLCIMHQPHAGSTGSIVTKLPFPIVRVCRADTAGVISLVVLIDSLLPDATKALLRQSGVFKRIFLLKVAKLLCHALPRITYAAGVAVMGVYINSGIGAHRRRLPISRLASWSAREHAKRLLFPCSSRVSLGHTAIHQLSSYAFAQHPQVQRCVIFITATFFICTSHSLHAMSGSGPP